ncbi:MAG TPA: antibiotic biosynthesis monooxygenase [Staphylococcus kloosii]|uniref:Signal transduction protein TRAP n=1 Tax=Staphylococcus kloosii TaxID=29384 RepID=A0A921GZS8_9STAP|nr:antibiotic biosynthesis monooxygenase [Staphylococcus kloosii]HJF67652.1 antibiotic biosynthesis monooxygenase [Staphylococcus kloosii]
MLKNEEHQIALEQVENQVTITKFNETQQYDILEQINEVPQNGYAILNHLYVNPGFEADFEQVFLNRDQHLQEVEGFQSLLFLKPQIEHLHYVIVTIWTDEVAYKNWQASNAYKGSHKNRGTHKGADKNIVNRDLSFNIGINLYGNV